MLAHEARNLKILDLVYYFVRLAALGTPVPEYLLAASARRSSASPTRLSASPTPQAGAPRPLC